MQITKKRLLFIAFGAFIATLIIRFATVFSIQDVYRCSTSECIAMSQADTKIFIGGILQYVSMAVLFGSLVMLLYFWMVKKK